MTGPRQRRQYARYSINLDVQLTIADDYAKQVNPLVGQRQEAILENFSGGGARTIVGTYLPRGTHLHLQLPPTAGGHKVHAEVMTVDMVDREPRYGLGLRFSEDHGQLAEQLRALADTTDEETASDPTRLRAPADPNWPRWMSVLLEHDVVEADILHECQQATANDENRAADWLIQHGQLSPADIQLARAEVWNLPFVDPGEYRLAIENHRILREELCRSQTVFPLFALDRIITLAVLQPLDLGMLDQIRLQTGCEVDQCLVTTRELQHLIDWAYGDFHDAATTEQDLDWGENLDDVSDAPVVKLVDVLLDRAVGSRASDVHIDAEESRLRVRFRVDGVLREVPAPPRSLLPAIVSRIKVLAHLNIAETRRPQDGHFKLASNNEELDIRVSTLPSAHGEAVVMRLLSSGGRLLSLEDLGMQTDCLRRFDQLIHMPHGMLLVTGPTGSGKTTTLYSALTRLDRVRQSIITLEDPVEVRLPQVRQVAVNPKAGLTFQAGLRSILRQDPDVIMVGEIRDRETAEIALQAALTGHIVLATLHTNSAAAATTRLLDMGVPDFLVASSLLGVLAQRLCRRLCPHCARPAEKPPKGLEALAEQLFPDTPIMEAVGCKRCSHTGYEGRLGIFELLVVTEEIRRAIFARQDDQAIAEIARQQGTRLLVEDGVEKVGRGKTTLAELLRVAGHIGTLAPTTNAARSTPHQATTDDTFDIGGYDELLRIWLQPATTTAVNGSN